MAKGKGKTSLYETWMPAWNGVRGEVKGRAQHDIFNTAHGHMGTWAHALMVRIHSCWAFTLHGFSILWKASAQPGEVNISHFSFQKKEVGPEDAEYAFPEAVLRYIRNIAPGDMKGGIREVCLLLIYSLQYFLNQILLCWKLCWSRNNYVEFLIFVTGCF